MYRRVLSLLLLPCVLVAQSANLGHAHGINEPVGHSLRQHVHLQRNKPHEHDGHHHHHGNGHHHHHDAEDLNTDTPSHQSSSGHDVDAFYVHAVDVVIENVKIELDDAAGQWADTFAPAEWHSVSLAQEVSVKVLAHPPPLPDGDSPRYIQFLTIVI